ncbi:MULTISPECIES: thiamine-phosphate kinase [unclassified Fibrobacter]|uniref:thiamine-phosphate kinase n=1 Tax=unclassified Fibrobacter TaxID=2634177 RepID=UPI000D6B4516|nr:MULTISPECIES: thiamine-phosphate kinase [unclassified Fibrobacter]PWJ60696.1 thiamine-phosphate kinase [Fibrobacter sp. UWR4]PZW63900.1 thiamine-phosphate kinase [Fibrobacter sp. UWR1]
MIKLGEFQFIESLLQNATPLAEIAPKTRTWLGVGDDAAIFDGWVVTKDLSVENTHFRLNWSTPEQAVEKHIVSNVSDICSMGARPRIALLGLCLNRHWSDEIKARVRKALSDGFAKRGITLIGGDTVSGEEGVFSTTLLGELAGDRPLVRTALKPGDNLYVNGTLGKSGAGLWLLLNHPEDRAKFPELVEYHLNPKIPEHSGEELARMNAYGACMDISDGLSSELNHLAHSSGVSIEIDEKKLPIDPQVVKMCEYYGISPLEFALNGGEEYQLLFANSLPDSIFTNKNVLLGEVCKIGVATVNAVEPKVAMLCQSGEKVPVEPRAWSHL